MYKQILLSIVCSLAMVCAASAQVTVSGTVTDSETGEVLPGVNVFLEETQQGAATDVDGNFDISQVAQGSYTLIATFIGYDRFSTSLEVGASNVEFNIELQPSVLGLDDVVVTAFGIQRDRRALGYGISSVDTESIGRRQSTDIARALSGKLPGVDIGATGGITGGGTDIVIRGFTTMTGSNDPLFIVDGVRFDGGRNTTDSWSQGGGATTTPNRFMDLDPKNIENVTVLKGLSATVLYGEQGRNGVILIETKSGSFREDQAPGFQVTLDQSVYATQISSRPDYQDTYGIGFDQEFGWFFSNWGPRFDDTDPGLYGTHFRGIDDDGTVLLRHPLTVHAGTAEAFPEYANATYRYQPYADPIDAFFRTGLAASSNLNVSGGIEDLRLNLSYGRTGEEGFTPNNDLTRESFGIGVNYRINPRLFAQTSFNMSLTDMKSPPLAAGGGSGPAAVGGTTSVFADVFYTPRSIDIMNIPFENPITGGSAYYRAGNDIPHPMWTLNNVGVSNNTNRYFGRTEINFQATENIHLVYRLGYDSYTENRDYRQNPGGVRPDDLLDGFYQTIETNRSGWDHTFNALLNYQLSSDFSLDGTIGAQFATERSERQGIESHNMLVFDFFKHSNFIDQSTSNFFSPFADFQRLVERQNAGVFADLTLGYRDIVYLNVAGRNDWFSTLEIDNRSIFYPSTSLSYIVSDHLDITGDFLTYLKLYGGVGTSAGSPSPYSTRNVLSTNPRAFVSGGSLIPTNATSSFLGNPALKPELHTEFEAGVDARFFDGRLGLDVTAYTRSTTDLITQTPLDPATGFTQTLVNIGEIVNEGIEVSLMATPVLRDWRWDIQTNFFADRSEVKELAEGFDRIQVGGGFTTRGNFAIPGEPFMVMLGSRALRVTEELRQEDSNFANVPIGTPIIGSTGNYIEEDEIDVIGNPNPDFTLAVTNTLRYRGLSLSFQVDYQYGGDMFSTWISTLMARGLTTDTDIVDRSNTFILPGVNEAGQTNNVQLSPSGVFFSNFGFGPDDLRVYDMTHLRLSEVALSYDLPSHIVGLSPFQTVTFQLTGNNLWMFAFNVPEGSGFDPNVNSIGGNSRGFEYLTGPAVRTFGGSLRVQF